MDVPLCTDQSFADQVQKEHHEGVSPFLSLQVDLISSLPLDYMHLVCLGVVQKLLLRCLKEPVPYRQPSLQTRSLPAHLTELKHISPSEFNHPPQSLELIENWKATKFHAFLLYWGPSVLYHILDDQKYYPFLLLHTAIFIFGSKSLTVEFMGGAEVLFCDFVSQARSLYGKSFLVYNVHGLIHLASDARIHGRCF